VSAIRKTSSSEPQFIKLKDGLLAVLRSSSEPWSEAHEAIMESQVNGLVRDLNESSKKPSLRAGGELVLIGSPALIRDCEAALKLPRNVKLTAVPREGEFSAYYFAQNGRIRLEKTHPIQSRKRKILIVDDSVTIRKLLRQIFSRDPELEVVAEAGLPSQVEGLIKTHRPDVITLDIGLPEMNGVELLQKYLPAYSIPTVMISALSQSESPLVLKSLESGAVDYIQKPVHEQLSELAPLIIEKVKTASHARVRRYRGRVANTALGNLRTDVLVAIGSSTGGTEAVCDVLSCLPKNIPPIVITQHIPAVFSAAFAKRLNDFCPFEVREAKDGDHLVPGLALIAPGGLQMGVEKRGGNLRVYVRDDAPVNRHKPSVDYLFDSVVKAVGEKAIGVILTGMGADGAKGLARMRAAGAFTIGQDEATCVVYGMPRAAMKEDAVVEQLPLEQIGPRLIEKLS
jgi:two-component system chemotaxis response regulator CheB